MAPRGPLLDTDAVCGTAICGTAVCGQGPPLKVIGLAATGSLGTFSGSATLQVTPPSPVELVSTGSLGIFWGSARLTSYVVTINTIPAQPNEVVRGLITAASTAEWIYLASNIGSISADSDLAVSSGLDLDRIRRVTTFPGYDLLLRFNSDVDGTGRWMEFYGTDNSGENAIVWIATRDGIVDIHASDILSVGGRFVNYIPDAEARALINGVKPTDRINLVMSDPAIELVSTGSLGTFSSSVTLLVANPILVGLAATGSLGTFSSSATLQVTPPGSIELTATGSLGTFSGATTLQVTPPSPVELASTGSLGTFSGSATLQLTPPIPVELISTGSLGTFSSAATIQVTPPSTVELVSTGSLGTFSGSARLAVLPAVTIDTIPVQPNEVVRGLITAASTAQWINLNSNIGSISADSDLTVSSGLALGRIRRVNASVLRFNSVSGNTDRWDGFYGADNPGENAVVWIATTGGIADIPASALLSAGGGFINYSPDAEARALINGVNSADLINLVISNVVPPAIELTATGSLGTFSGSATLQVTPPGSIELTATGSLGTFSGSATLQVTPPSSIELASTGSLGTFSGSATLQVTPPSSVELVSTGSLGTFSGSATLQVTPPSSIELVSTGSLGTFSGSATLTMLPAVTIDTIPVQPNEVVRGLITAASTAQWIYLTSNIGSISADSDLAVSSGLDLDRILWVGGSVFYWTRAGRNRDRWDGFYGADNPGENAVVWIATTGGIADIPASDVSGTGEGYVTYTPDAEARALIGRVNSADLINLVISNVVPPAIELLSTGSLGTFSSSATLLVTNPSPGELVSTGSLGTFSSSASLQVTPPSPVELVSTGSLGTFSGSATLQITPPSPVELVSTGSLGTFSGSAALQVTPPSSVELVSTGSLGTFSGSATLSVFPAVTIDTIPVQPNEVVRGLITAASTAQWIYLTSNIGSISADSDLTVSSGLVLNRIRRVNASVIRFNGAGGNTDRWDGFYGTNNAGERAVVWIATTGGIVDIPASDLLSAGGGFVNYSPDAEARVLINGVNSADLINLVISNVVPPAIELASTGSLGTFSGSATLQVTPPSSVELESTGSLGTFSGSATLQVTPPILVELVSTGSLGTFSGSATLRVTPPSSIELVSTGSLGTFSSSATLQVTPPIRIELVSTGSLGTFSGSATLLVTNPSPIGLVSTGSLGTFSGSARLRVERGLPSFGGQSIPEKIYPLNLAIQALLLPKAFGGTGTLVYSLTPALPTGIVVNTATRLVTGTPTVAQAAEQFTYTVTDGNGNTDSIIFSMRVRVGGFIWELNIAGTNYIDYADYQTIVPTDSIRDRSDTLDGVALTIDFTGNTPAIPIPQELQTIELVRNGEKEFSGVILRVDETLVVGDSDSGMRSRGVYTLTCADYTRWLDRRLVVEDYPVQTAQERIRAVVTSFTDGFTTVNVEGVFAIPEQRYEYQKVSTVLDQLGALLNHIWYVDFERDLHFVPAESMDAPIPRVDLDDKFNLRVNNIMVTGFSDQIVNRVYVKDARTRSDDTYSSDTYMADGATSFWPLDYDPANVTEFKATFGKGTPDEVVYSTDMGNLKLDIVENEPGSGPSGSDQMFLCLDNRGCRIDSDFIPTAGTTVDMEYKTLTDRVVTVEDPTSIELVKEREGGDSSGIYEAVISAPQLVDVSVNAVEAFGEQLLLRQAFPGKSGTFEVYGVGWQAGQSFILRSTRHHGSIEIRMFILEVSKVIQENNTLLNHVTFSESLWVD